jgi:hypothetical protein
LPLMSEGDKGQQNLKRIILHFHILIEYFSRILVV